MSPETRLRWRSLPGGVGDLPRVGREEGAPVEVKGEEEKVVRVLNLGAQGRDLDDAGVLRTGNVSRPCTVQRGLGSMRKKLTISNLGHPPRALRHLSRLSLRRPSGSLRSFRNNLNS